MRSGNKLNWNELNWIELQCGEIRSSGNLSASPSFTVRSDEHLPPHPDDVRYSAGIPRRRCRPADRGWPGRSSGDQRRRSAATAVRRHGRPERVQAGRQSDNDVEKSRGTGRLYRRRWRRRRYVGCREQSTSWRHASRLQSTTASWRHSARGSSLFLRS